MPRKSNLGDKWRLSCLPVAKGARPILWVWLCHVIMEPVLTPSGELSPNLLHDIAYCNLKAAVAWSRELIPSLFVPVPYIPETQPAVCVWLECLLPALPATHTTPPYLHCDPHILVCQAGALP